MSAWSYSNQSNYNIILDIEKSEKIIQLVALKNK